MATTDKKKNTIEINNRKARFNYVFIETYVAGIVLTGTEIKSIRDGKASLVDTYCYVDFNNEVWMKNSYIAKYENGTHYNHEERRLRKLLLTKKEINKLKKETEKPGYTVVPVKMFINEHGLCKVVIALAKGKKDYDKRESIKERDVKREIDAQFKKF